MNLKILIYGINYFPELTGIGKYTGEMCEWLAKKGHNVTVITALPYYPQWKIYKEYKGKKFLREKINGVTIYRSPIYLPKKITGKTRILHELSFSFSSLIWWLGLFKNNYDVVIGICPPLQIGIFPLIYKSMKKKPFIFHIQDLQVDAARELGLIKNKHFLRVAEKVERFLLKKATIVSTISEGMKNKIAEKGIDKSKIFMLPNWVDTDFIKPIPKEQSLRKQFGFKIEDKIILYSGNIGEKQGLDIIIDVAKKFKNSKNTYFVFCGDGAAKERLIQKATSLPNVKFFSLQPYKKLPELLAVADIHLVTQKRAAADLVMPSKLTSILSAGGLAIITADKETSLYNIVKNNNIGIVVEPENAEALYKAIKLVLDRPEKFKFIKTAARKYAEEKLNKELILTKFESLLKSLCIGGKDE